MLKKTIWGCLLPLMSILSGCMSSQEMRLHYAAVDLDEANPQIKFYRVTLHGSSSNVKANMTTGYYDANTLRYLYGDVRSGADSGNGGSASPTSNSGSGGKPVSSSGQIVMQFDPATKTWSQVPATTLFTMIYGADSQALSDAIKSFGDNDQTGLAMGQLFARAAGGDTYDAAVSSEQQQQTVTANVKKLDSAIGTLVTGYTNTAYKVTSALLAGSVSLPPPDQIDQQMLATVQQAITLLGSSTTLPKDNPADGFAQAQKVYQLLNQSPAK